MAGSTSHIGEPFEQRPPRARKLKLAAGRHRNALAHVRLDRVDARGVIGLAHPRTETAGENDRGKNR